MIDQLAVTCNTPLLYMDDVLFRWRTEGVRLNGRFSIDSQGHKNMQTTSQITSSLVEAKGGVVGGQVNLHKFNHTCMYYLLFSETLHSYTPC